MANRVFFSFHYEDVKTFRANVVRNHWLTKEDTQSAGFFDASIWEDSKKIGDLAVKRLINSNLENTSVTCALIGTETWQRRWVRYELMKSYDKGNKLLGVHINGIRDRNQNTFANGRDVFDYLGFIVSEDGIKMTYYEHDGNGWKVYKDLDSKKVYGIDRQHWGKGFKLSNWIKVYDWNLNDGYNNFQHWIENLK